MALIDDPRIEAFIAYVAEYDAEFPSRVRGASEAEIVEFEHAVGARLDPAHRAFLLRMGHAHEGFAIDPAGRDDVTSLIAYYRDVVVPGDATVPPDHVVFFCFNPSLTLYVRREEGRLGPVVARDRPKPLGHSVGRFLHQTHCGVRARRRFEYDENYVGQPRTECHLPVAALARRFAMDVTWFSDDRVTYAESERGALLLVQSGGVRPGLWVYSRADDDDLQDALYEAIQALGGFEHRER